MKWSRAGLAVAVLVSLALASFASADVNYGVTPSNGKPAPGPIMYGWSGSDWLPVLVDGSGNVMTRGAIPNMVILNHRSNVTLASAANDSSAIPFQSSAYRQMFALVRIKAASFSAGGYLELAVRANSSATADSTALGWWFPLGTGARSGKTVRLTSLLDRWKMIPLTDSLTNAPYQAQFTSLYLSNFTGAQMIYDVWLLGIPW